jgi:hypothetical protein
VTAARPAPPRPAPPGPAAGRAAVGRVEPVGADAVAVWDQHLDPGVAVTGLAEQVPGDVTDRHGGRLAQRDHDVCEVLADPARGRVRRPSAAL